MLVISLCSMYPVSAIDLLITCSSPSLSAPKPALSVALSFLVGVTFLLEVKSIPAADRKASTHSYELLLHTVHQNDGSTEDCRPNQCRGLGAGRTQRAISRWNFSANKHKCERTGEATIQNMLHGGHRGSESSSAWALVSAGLLWAAEGQEGVGTLG